MRRINPEIKIAILKEFRQQDLWRLDGISFSEFKKRFIVETKMINSETTLSKYLKLLVKEGLLKKDIDTRTYKITNKGRAYLNEVEFWIEKDNKSRWVFFFDLPEEEAKRESFLEEIRENFLRVSLGGREPRVLPPFQGDILFEQWLSKYMPFALHIYINKEFGKASGEFLERLSDKGGIFTIQTLFEKIIAALYETQVREITPLSRRLEENNYWMQKLKTDIEKIELLKRAAPVILIWPRIPQWWRDLMQKENLDKLIEKAKERDQLEKKIRMRLEERLKEDQNLRKEVIRFFLLLTLYHRYVGFANRNADLIGKYINEQEADLKEKLEQGLLEALWQEMLERMRDRTVKGVNWDWGLTWKFSSELERNLFFIIFTTFKFEPRPEEIMAEIKWLREQGVIDPLVESIMQFIITEKNLYKTLERVVELIRSSLYALNDAYRNIIDQKIGEAQPH